MFESRRIFKERAGVPYSHNISTGIGSTQYDYTNKAPMNIQHLNPYTQYSILYTHKETPL